MNESVIIPPFALPHLSALPLQSPSSPLVMLFPSPFFPLLPLSISLSFFLDLSLSFASLLDGQSAHNHDSGRGRHLAIFFTIIAVRLIVHP